MSALYATHEVTNQPPLLQDYNLLESDRAMAEAVTREGADWAHASLSSFGALMGRAETIEWGFLANRHLPELQTHDRYGHRIDQVRFHPAYHHLMDAAMAAQTHCLAWSQPRDGAHVARIVLHYLLTQTEASVACPITMTFAAVPALRMQPDVAAEWVPRITQAAYDPRFIPAEKKKGCTMGMAMTEKQGGSDVRANTTQARPLDGGGSGGEYLITGHKWFCSAPMCDAFLTLAQSAGGLSCFLVPRFLPDGSQNRFFIQRLKDKMGNKANASSEIEYVDTWARMVGEEGRGVRTIIEMVNHTRLDCISGSAALMRQALTQALHHISHREAFGKRLVDQSLMRNVAADLALDVEAAVVLLMRLARAYDESDADPMARALARLGTAMGKFHVCKQAPSMIFEAMECHGGAGYVEESMMPRLYREAPLLSIWEGSGNVMCLDVLRALQREPAGLEALQAELARARGVNAHYDRALAALQTQLGDREHLELRARHLVTGLVTCWQAGLLLQHAPSFVADAFCASRLDQGRRIYGTLAPGTDFEAIISRAR